MDWADASSVLNPPPFELEKAVVLVYKEVIAVYNSEIDKNVEDVMIRADHLMYENKHMRKSNDENK